MLGKMVTLKWAKKGKKKKKSLRGFSVEYQQPESTLFQIPITILQAATLQFCKL